MTASLTIRVGRPAYPRSSMNRAAWHTNYRTALGDLLSRRVPMRDAHRALHSAIAGSLATAPRYYKGTHVESVEVIADRA